MRARRASSARHFSRRRDPNAWNMDWQEARCAAKNKKRKICSHDHKEEIEKHHTFQKDTSNDSTNGGGINHVIQLSDKGVAKERNMRAAESRRSGIPLYLDG